MAPSRIPPCGAALKVLDAVVDAIVFVIVTSAVTVAVAIARDLF